MNLHRLLTSYICERQAIDDRKRRRQPRPWTKDPILDRYKFTTNHRRTDYMTRLFVELMPSLPLELMLVNAVAFRFFSDEALWRRVTYLRAFSAQERNRWLSALSSVKRANLPYQPGAVTHLASSCGLSLDAAMTLVIWDVADRRRVLARTLREATTIREQFDTLRSIRYIGSFLAYEMLVLLHETKALAVPRNNRSTFYVLGPGARKAMKILDASDFLTLYARHRPSFPCRLSLMDFEHCLCEFYKYYSLRVLNERPVSVRVYEPRS